MYCLGCGVDITDKATNRRSLQGAAAKKVVAVWKSFIELFAEESGPDVDCDSLITGDGDQAHAGKMCRTCYSAYERYIVLQQTMKEKLRSAINVISPNVACRPKRPRVEIPQMHMSQYEIPALHSSLQLQHASSSAAVSPDVAVSWHNSAILVDLWISVEFIALLLIFVCQLVNLSAFTAMHCSSCSMMASCMYAQT